MQEFAFSVDELVPEAGRALMAEMLSRILAEDGKVRLDADVTAVHEMRKSIRRTFTCFKLFNPYFEPGVLRQYKRPLGRLMRRLATSRDLAVFRLKLAAFNEANDWAYEDLAAYFNMEQEVADSLLIRYLKNPKRQEFFASYLAFTASRGLGVRAHDRPGMRSKIGHHLPVLIFTRVATVRAFEDGLSGASLKELHRLRIQFKDLRYALQFFAPLLGGETSSIFVDLKALQDILGDLNDTAVALQLLDTVPDREASVARYRQHQREEQLHLLEAFQPAWEQFNRPQWRRALAKVAVSF
jgi:CHAD domain-containing protein